MDRFKQFVCFIFTKKFFKKFFAYGLLVAFIYLFSGFAFIFFLTFIFAYLFSAGAYSLAKKFHHFLSKFFSKFFKSSKKEKIIKKIFGFNFFVILEYILFVIIIILLLSSILPKLISELTEITNSLPFLTEQVDTVTKTLKELKQDYTEIGGTITQVINSKDYEVLAGVFQKLKDVGVIFLEVILALVLSLVFIIDRKKLNKYLSGIKKSNFKFLYHEYLIIFDKIVKSFGLILKAQTMIAFVNAMLTIVGLYIIGGIYGIIFPYILTLGLIVFIFGFVPVLGVFLSSIPIIIVGYTAIGGYDIIIAISILVIIVHAIEAYYLNPKIVSSFLDFPVSLTFLILIISEHVFGFAGLLIGVSLFYFLIGVLKDIDLAITKKKKKLTKKGKKLKNK